MDKAKKLVILAIVVMMLAYVALAQLSSHKTPNPQPASQDDLKNNSGKMLSSNKGFFPKAEPAPEGEKIIEETFVEKNLGESEK